MISPLLRLSLSVALGVLSITAASSQTAQSNRQADTLRRSLKVMTSQEARLSSKAPMSVALSAPKVYTAEAQPFAPKPLAKLTEPVQVSPLSSMTPLPSLYAKSEQLGYLSASLGLLYNARFGAGIRPLNTKTDMLDLHLSGYWVHNDERAEYPALDIREQSLGAEAEYKHIGSQTLWSIRAGYDWARQLRYGLVRGLNDKTPTSGELALWDEVKRTYWTSQQFRLSGLVQSNPEQSRLWHYQITPQFNLSRLGEITEVNPALSIGFDHKLQGYGKLRLDLQTALFFYNNARIKAHNEPDAPETNSAYIQLSPSWMIDGVESGFAWGAQLGLGLAATRVEAEERSPLLLYPKIDAYINWSDSWLLRAEIDGGIRPNGMAQHYRLYRQMYMLNQPEFTRVPLHTKLSLKGLIKPNFALEIFGGYELLRNVEDYALLSRLYTPIHSTMATNNLNASATPPSHSFAIIEGYKRFYRDGALTHHWQLGGSLAYTFYHAYTFSVGAKVDGWKLNDDLTATPEIAYVSSALSGRPTFTLESNVRYRPSDVVEVNVGYRILAGIKYPSMVSKHAELANEAQLNNFNCFTFSANYRPHKQWTVTLDGQYAPDTHPSLILGYRLQPFTFNLGFGYTF